MATLQEQFQKAKKLTLSNQSRDLFKFIRSIEKEILDLERKRISEDSKDIFGKPIGFYSFFTDHLTNGIKKAGEPFTGKDTGKWFDGFYMQEVAGVLRFGSRDPKTKDILSSEHWLSHELFGLSDEDLKEVIETRLLPFFIENGRNILDI
jgi:hypothetical protein